MLWKIENNINHKVYIGQSVDIEKRWQRHKQSEDNCPIHKAFKKYGIENFTFTIIEECEREQLDEKEQYYIKYYDSYNNGYNLTIGGQGSLWKDGYLNIAQVREIQNLLKTTTLTNIEIGKMYGVSENTVVSINTGKSWYNDEIEYPIRKSYIRKKYYCNKCGIEIKSSTAQFCVNCSRILSRKVERPSKEQLKIELEKLNGNFTQVAKKYGVTDNSVRKWCKTYNLPTHSADYKTSKEGKNLLPVKVQQIDIKTGKIINEFNSLEEAFRKTKI